MKNKNKNKGMTLIEASIFASLIGIIGFFAVKVGLVYKQKATMQKITDKYEAKFDGAFLTAGDYLTQVSTLMDESTASLVAAGLEVDEGFSPVIYRTPNGWAVTTGVLIMAPKWIAYLAEVVDPDDLEESDISVEKDGVTYRMKDPSMSDPKYIVYNYVPTGDSYDFSQTRNSQAIANVHLRDYPTTIELYGYNTWGGLSWPVRATQSHFVTIASASDDPTPTSNDCSDLTGVDVTEMNAVCAIAYPGSQVINTGAPNLTGINSEDGSAEAICCECINGNNLVDGCHVPPADYIGRDAVDDTDLVPNPIVTLAPTPTCPPPYQGTSFCDNASETNFYCIECHPNPSFSTYCGRCISDRQTACTTCTRVHCEQCDEDGPPPVEEWFYRGDFDKRCWVPSLCGGKDEPPEDGDDDDDNKEPPKRPFTPNITPYPEATVAGYPPCPEGVDEKGKPVTFGGMRCPVWNPATCQFDDKPPSCPVDCTGGATEKLVFDGAKKICECIPCPKTIASIATSEIDIEHSHTINLTDGGSDVNCAILGGTLGAVFTRDGTDWQQCHCSTGFGDNGCTTGTCTLVNRFEGAFRCEDASGDPHWSSCQDLGGSGGGSETKGQYCMCGGLLASGSTDCKTFAEDYSTACTETGGTPTGVGSRFCDYSGPEATCTGAGDTWNSTVNICETAGGGGGGTAAQDAMHEACVLAGQCVNTVGGPPEGMCVPCGVDPIGSFYGQDASSDDYTCESMGGGSMLQCLYDVGSLPVPAAELSPEYTDMGAGMFDCPGEMAGHGGCYTP